MKKGITAPYLSILLIIVLIAVLAVNIFIYTASDDITGNIIGETTASENEFNIDLEGYEKANVSMFLTNIRITNECRMISFDVTSDQAYSISRPFLKEPSIRPLTHDILRDVLETFEIEILAGMITDYKNGIYYAKIYAKQGNRVLELDARPSDTIALLLRLEKPLYVNSSVLENGIYIC